MHENNSNCSNVKRFFDVLRLFGTTRSSSCTLQNSDATFHGIYDLCILVTRTPITYTSCLMEISCTVSDEIETWALLFNTKPRIIISWGIAY